MINKDFLTKKKNLTKITTIEELKGCYIKKPTVRDIKEIAKFKNEDEIMQSLKVIEILIVNEKGEQVFTEEEINDFDITIFKELSEIINNVVNIEA